MPTTLTEEMRSYEDVPKTYLDSNLPIVIRMDMRSGSTFTKDLVKPFDAGFDLAMRTCAEDVAKRVPGCVMAYVHSDEVSLIVNPSSEVEFSGGVEKIASTSASECTASFIRAALKGDVRLGHFYILRDMAFTARFDSRCFNLPDDGAVRDYLAWRQRDAVRNSVSSMAFHVFGHSRLLGLSTDDKIELLGENGHSWDAMPESFKYGTVIERRRYLKPADPLNPMSRDAMRWGWFSSNPHPIVYYPDKSSLTVTK